MSGEGEGLLLVEFGLGFCGIMEDRTGGVF